ncbi:MAG: hypothetical protein ISR84_04930 [Kiritimatiellales bacterium]|nr:hypothetical protein [Kiritimatiellales bacterium]
MKKAFLAKAITAFIGLLCFAAPCIFADAYLTEWWSNKTSYQNVYEDGPESPRLAYAYNGFLEGTVALPREDLWQVELSVKADGNFNHPDDYVRVFVNSELIADIPNMTHGSPPDWVWPITHQISGSSFTYRFEMHSLSSSATSHQQVGPGTVTVAYMNNGFEPPMDNGPVTVKKNRVLPLKVKLLKNDGLLATDLDILSPPVLQVEFFGVDVADGVDVSDQALPAGKGSDGNAFSYTDDGVWQFNLKTSNYTAPGTYYITVVSGDAADYVISGAAEASFTIK